MDCKYAYEKKGISYILCSKEAEPVLADRTALFHAVCAHQVDCQRQRCRKLSPLWKNCAKLRESAQNATEDEKNEVISVDGEAPKKRTRKATAAKSEK